MPWLAPVTSTRFPEKSNALTSIPLARCFGSCASSRTSLPRPRKRAAGAPSFHLRGALTSASCHSGGDFRRLDARFLVADQPEHLLPELSERRQLRHLQRALRRKRCTDLNVFQH